LPRRRVKMVWLTPRITPTSSSAIPTGWHFGKKFVPGGNKKPFWSNQWLSHSCADLALPFELGGRVMTESASGYERTRRYRAAHPDAYEREKRRNAARQRALVLLSREYPEAFKILYRSEIEAAGLTPAHEWEAECAEFGCHEQDNDRS